MRSIRAWRPADAEHIKLKNDDLGYFRRDGSRLHYGEYRAEGLHIGSGIAETAGRLPPNQVADISEIGTHYVAIT